MTRAPRRRIVIASLGLVVMALVATSCGNGELAAVSASLESGPRPSAPELPELPDDLEDVLPPDLTVPDMSVPEDIPGSDEVQECVDLTSAYTEVVVLAFGGDPDGRLPDLFAQLDAAAPADVRDDLAVVRDVATEASEGGLLDATGAMLAEEFTDANAVVVEWLTVLCSGEGG